MWNNDLLAQLIEENDSSTKLVYQLVNRVADLQQRVEKLEHAAMTVSGKNYEQVEIDSGGVFKYVLIRCNGEDLIVRGFKWANYHADIYDQVEMEMTRKGVKCSCIGGGRIDHDSDNKRIIVYGYSVGFGRADHAKTVQLLLKKYPDYDITFSNDGY